jgi:hypothetical protein
MYADVVSSLALAAALGSIGWQVTKEIRWDRPLLSVSGRLMYSGRGTDRGDFKEYWDLEVVAANVGNAATQIVDVYWEFERAGDTNFQVRGSETPESGMSIEFNGELQIHDGDVSAAGPALPQSIGRNDVVTWLFERPRPSNAVIDEAVQGRPVVVFVSRTRRPEASDSGRNPNLTTAHGDWVILAEFPDMIGGVPAASA